MIRLMLVLLILLSGCASTPVEIRPLVICPPIPSLPIVYAEELDPLEEDVYERVIDRDQGWQDYAEELLTICKALK